MQPPIAVIFSEDSWLRTGDLAVMNETGHVRITGRIKDIINRGGVKLNPSDVEALIDQHEAVLQSAIVPVPDPILGERACCCVVLKPGKTLSLDALCAWLQGQGVAKFKWPERLVSHRRNADDADTQDRQGRADQVYQGSTSGR